jgi:hypothetical protein
MTIPFGGVVRYQLQLSLCHPDVASNASGRTGFWPPDSGAQAPPVPVLRCCIQ